MRVGVLDSGVARPGASAARRFWAEAGGVSEREGSRPFATHGTAIARLIRAAAPEAVLLDAQIFERSLHCPPAVAAAGLDWLIEEGAAVVNLSWGLAGEASALEAACRRARSAGVWLVAATPIRGAAPAPARYAGVVSATGDARCAPGEHSDFGGHPADFGASPVVETRDGPLARGRGGSSFASARVCGALVRALLDEPGSDPRAVLRRAAAHRGPQTDPRSARG